MDQKLLQSPEPLRETHFVSSGIRLCCAESRLVSFAAPSHRPRPLSARPALSFRVVPSWDSRRGRGKMAQSAQRFAPALEGVAVKKHCIAIALAGVVVLFAALPVAAQDPKGNTQPADSQHTHWYSPSRYNPAKLFHRGSKTESDQPAAPASRQSAPAETDSSSTHWYSPSKYNPAKLFRRDSKTATDELAANSDEAKRLTFQLQAHRFLPPHTDIHDACSSFNSVEDCVAAIHAAHDAGIQFDCLKWAMTAVPPDATSSCSPPPNDKPLSLVRAIRFLKPDADADSEAKTALRQARDDISDATS